VTNEQTCPLRHVEPFFVVADSNGYRFMVIRWQAHGQMGRSYTVVAESASEDHAWSVAKALSDAFVHRGRDVD
jgi:hypothetical protein